jgi:hypothetical protein
MLFAADLDKKQNVLFKFDKEKNRWYVEFEEQEGGDKSEE